MFRIFLYIIILFVCNNLYAQKNYFIYIQSENGSPFYARISDKIYSSSSGGHLTISSLVDSTYNVYIGFPRSQSIEQNFSISISQKDRGFELKNLAREEWVLFDWQSMNLIRSQSKSASSGGVNMERRSDPYAMLMAGVVNDSSVLYYSVMQQETTPIAQSQAQAKAATIQEALIDTGTKLVSSADTAVVAVEVKMESPATVVDSPIPSDSTISIASTPQALDRDDSVLISKNEKPELLRELLSDSTVERWYFDSQDPADTVYVRIESEKLIEQLPVSVANDEVVITENPTDIADPSVSKVADTVQVEPKIVMINSDCRNFASDYDLDKLRVLLLKEKTDKAKLNVARKVFRTLCFSTRQVRAMTELFSADEGKFLLFETAYPFVSDTGNFKSLEQLLSDPFYVTRFKLMTGS